MSWIARGLLISLVGACGGDSTSTTDAGADSSTGGDGSTVDAGPLFAGVTDVAVGEYQVFFITPEGELYGLGRRVGAGPPGDVYPLQRTALPEGTRAIDVASGLHHSLALTDDGRVWTMGSNTVGQGGNGTVGGYLDYPYHVATDIHDQPFGDVIAIEAIYDGSVALKSDGTVWVWGVVDLGRTGDGTDGGTVLRPQQVPAFLPQGVKVVQLAVNASTIFARADDGTVWSWGASGNMQTLGTGATDRTRPHQLTALPADIVSVTAGSGCGFALTADGQLYGWGYNGERLGIGDGIYLNHPTPTPIALNDMLGITRPVKQVVAGSNSTHVILDDGSLWGWGDNAMGTVGNGPSLDFSMTDPPYAWSFGRGLLMQMDAARVVPDRSDFVRVWGGTSYGFYHYAMTADGHLYSWGRNKTGNLGNGITPATSAQAATYPNSWDVPLATEVNPRAVPAEIPTPSPWCVAHPDAVDCD